MATPPAKRAKKANTCSEDPSSDAADLFAWLISPISIEEFYQKHWEGEPLVIHRSNSDFYLQEHPMFTLDDLKTALREKDMMYGKNIDITNYREGNRVTLNEPGARVTYDQAMKRFEKDKCTLRVLHPQEFSDNLYKVCALLQEWFGCVVGSNVYITPADAQGFAPHYDDVDVFILQVEGRKLWRLYDSISEDTVLPEVSSGNFEQEQIGECVQEIWLEQGDLLYFPRGVIHQAITDKSSHSTHITISTVQKWTWYHYLIKAVPLALRAAFETNIEFRRALPLRFQDYMGIMYSDRESEDRTGFAVRTGELAQLALEYLPIDQAADLMCVDYIHDSLPPIQAPRNLNEPISVNRKIRLVSKSSVRITCEEESIFFYYNTRNTRIYHEVDPQYLEFPLEASDALEYIINSFPKFIQIDELPLEYEEDKIEVCRALLAAKIILIE